MLHVEIIIIINGASFTALVLQAMYEVVKEGDIDLLEDLLEKPNADITMVYVSTNSVRSEADKADQN